IDSKCWQTLQGPVIAHIFSSRDCGIPGGTEVARFPCIPENKLLELQAPTDPEIYQKVMCSQALPGAVIEHTKMSRSLPKGAKEKLGAKLQDKHLAFLSGLPPLYDLAPSKATGPPITSQSAMAGIMPEPVELTPEPLTEKISWEERCISPGPGLQDDETRADGAQDFLAKVQVEASVNIHSLEDAWCPESLGSVKTSILIQLNFHLRKKDLEIHLGIPIKVRESQNQSIAVLENLPTQYLNNQGKTSLQEYPIPRDSPHAPEQQLMCLRIQLLVEVKAVEQRKKQASSTAGPHGSAHRVAKISQLRKDTTGAQELCAWVEVRVNIRSREEAGCPESQGPGKTKDSAQVPTLAVKEESPRKSKPRGDSKEWNAGFGLPSYTENRHPAEDQKPAGLSVNRTPRGPWQRSQSFDITASSQQISKYSPKFKLPKLPPGTPGGKDSENMDLEDSEINLNLITQPGRTPSTVQPLLPQASQGQSLLGSLIQGNLLQNKILQNDTPLEQARADYILRSLDLAEFAFRNKTKCIFHCCAPKTVDEESIFSAGESDQNAKKQFKKSLAPAESPVGQVKTEKITEDPKAQSVPTDKEVSLAFSDDLGAPDKQLWHDSHHVHSGSVLVHLHSCLAASSTGLCHPPGNPP
uniref:Uncharacterized protein n=1 Tax=Loxodonta africana TaxID=9785 RepID=G3T1T9_LOXAF